MLAILTTALIAISTAQSTVRHYEATHFPYGTVGKCFVIDRHDSGCNVTGTYIISDQLPAQGYKWVDTVTRSGPCSVTGRITHRPNGITVVTGHKRYGNCFTGPIVVIPGELELA